MNGSTSVAFLMLLTADRPVAALIVGYVLSIAFNIIATVGVLRSTHRTDADPTLARVVRAAIIPVMVLLSLT